jgi:hypothetical protein
MSIPKKNLKDLLSVYLSFWVLLVGTKNNMKIFAPAKTFYFPIDQFVYTPRIVHKRPELKGHKFAAETAVRCSKVI